MATTLPALFEERSADVPNGKTVAIEPGPRVTTGSLGGHPNRDPSWLWPPPLYQAYCRLHFLKECSLYHLHESETFRVAVDALTPKTKKSRRPPTVPTRVQPMRRVRKDRKDDPRTATDRRTSPARNGKADRSFDALNTSRERLQLYLPWPIYKTQLEARIGLISEGLRERNQLESNYRPGHPSNYELRLECRYCRFEPEVIDRGGFAPRRLAPPAPMHYVELDDLKEEQMGEFGGIKFAVDIFGGPELIFLLGMEKLEDLGHKYSVG